MRSHHHHVLAAIVRVNFRDVQHWAVFKITSQLNRVRRLAQQIQLINQRFFIFTDHFCWSQAGGRLASGEVPTEQGGRSVLNPL
ncbi:Uncharacterised protein [Citrobacter freundii]|nr:Uncharacterised protein [Citrobacter freundii]